MPKVTLKMIPSLVYVEEGQDHRTTIVQSGFEDIYLKVYEDHAYDLQAEYVSLEELPEGVREDVKRLPSLPTMKL